MTVLEIVLRSSETSGWHPWIATTSPKTATASEATQALLVSVVVIARGDGQLE